MTTIARLYKDAELDIAGEINERLPKVTNGLLFNLPMDGSLIPETVGRNLLLDSDFALLNFAVYNTRDSSMYILSIDSTNKYNGYNSLKIISTSAGSVNHDIQLTVSKSISAYENLTISFYAKASIACVLTTRMGFTNASPQSSVSLSTEWQYYSFQLDTNMSVSYSNLIFQILDKTATYWLALPKVEIGIKPTPWTPAPEDVKAGIVATNCNLTNDGIYVEEGTTNLIGNHSINLSTNGWSFANHTDSGSIIKDPLRNNTTLWDVTSGGYMYLDVDTSLLTVGNNYTFSIYIYANKDFIFHYRWNNVYKAMLIKANTWARLINTQNYVVSSSLFDNRFLIGYRTYIDGSDITPDNFQVAYSMAQLEQKPYATSYTTGTRPNSSNGVQIPTSYFQFPFSVTMDVIPDIKDGSNSVYGDEPDHMYIAGLWKLNSGGHNGEIHQVHRDTLINGLEKGFRYTLVFRSTGYDIYINNTKVKNNLNYYSGAFNLSDIPMFTVGCRGYEPQYGYANALYKNIAFYNRELTQDDVNKLCNNKFSITKEGNINGFELIEDQNPNLLLDSSFPVNTTKWNIHTSNGISIDTTVKYLNNNSVKMVNSGTNRLDIPVQYYSQYTTNQIMTLSVYIMSPDVSQITNNMDCWIGFRNSSGTANGNISRQITSADFTKIGNNNWFKWIIQGSNIDTTNIYCTFMCATNNTAATVYVSSPKLKLGNTNKMSIKQGGIYLNELNERSEF